MARKKIGSLQIDVGANVAAMRKDLGTIKSLSERTFGSVQSTASKLKYAIGGIFTMAAIKGVADFSKGIIDSADNMAKLSVETGVSVANLSSLEHAAKLSGGNLNTLTTGIKSLSKNMYDFSLNSGEAKIAFQEMDISVTDTEGNLRSSYDVMMDVSDALAGMADNTKKNALAQKIFGRSGVKLLPMLTQGSTKIREMMREADSLGITITEVFGKDSEHFNDSLEKLVSSFKGLARDILPGVVELLTEAVDKSIEAVKAIKTLKKPQGEGTAKSTAAKGVSWMSDMASWIPSNPINILAKAFGEHGYVSKAYTDMTLGFLKGVDKVAAVQADKSKPVPVVLEQPTKMDTSGMWDGSSAFFPTKATSGKVFRDMGLQQMTGKFLQSYIQENFKPNDDFIDKLIDMDALKEYTDGVHELNKEIGDLDDQGAELLQQRYIESWADRSARAITDFVNGTKIQWSDMWQSMANDMLDFTLRQKILAPLFQGLFGDSVKGVFNIPAMANGGVAMASTFANIGEGSDAEAVLPLGRINGKLGVRSTGSGGMTVNIHNNGSSNVSASESEDGMSLDIIIEDMVVGSIGNGAADEAMRQRFGVLPAGMRR